MFKGDSIPAMESLHFYKNWKKKGGCQACFQGVTAQMTTKEGDGSVSTQNYLSPKEVPHGKSIQWSRVFVFLNE